MPYDIDRIAEAITAWAGDNDLEVERPQPRHVVVVLPGEKKLKTTVSIKCGVYRLSFQAFVVRKPDENHEAFYRWLLRANARLSGLAFAVDSYGDVYLSATLPTAVLTPAMGKDTFDRVLGGVLDDMLGMFLTTADESFNELLRIGFFTSIRREWHWRTTHGESTANLAAFAPLLEATGVGSTPDTPAENDASAPGKTPQRKDT